MSSSAQTNQQVESGQKRKENLLKKLTRIQQLKRSQRQSYEARISENQFESKILKYKRQDFHLTLYISYVFAATLLPLLNLLTLFTQGYSLSWQNNFASISRQNFEYYYIGISYYLASITIFLICSSMTPLPWRDLVKLYLLVDSNQICAIAASICYVALHLVYLCRDLAGNHYNITVADIFYLALLVINNFCFLGHFRSTLICYKWTPAITLTFKILIFISSLAYFAYGIMIIIGQDNLSNLLAQANSIVQTFVQSNDFGNLTAQVKLELMQQTNALSNNVSTIQNLISLFVFTSFANICQVLDRMNDFDKSSDLKPTYLIDDEDQEDHASTIEELKNMMTHKMDLIAQRIMKMPLQGLDHQPAIPNQLDISMNPSV